MYGLDELIPKKRCTLPLRCLRPFLFWISNNYKQRVLGERLRLALQELRPIWIKFGQMLSTRRDLFPSHIANQLAILQNNVKPFDGALARAHIEKSIGQPLENYFDDFQQEPLASASISQVHTARLKNGKEIVIKVIRHDILPIIHSDIRLMYRLASWIPYVIQEGKRFRSVEVVLEYEKILLGELNLLCETANTIQLRRNFNNSSMLYIPEVYPDFCSKTMLVMERIYGIPIHDVAALKKQNTNMQLLAERGVKFLFTQVFRDRFFHGDMHPGNIFVSFEHPEKPKYIAIDCGIVGSLNKEDKRYLAANFVAFFDRDYRKVAELHVDSGWVTPNTNIEDFERAIRTVCEPFLKKALSEISFAQMLFNLFKIARKFNMQVQPQLILLQKTLLYIEGIGRELYPQLDLWQTAKPFLDKWIKDQVSFLAILNALKAQGPYLAEKLPEFPKLFYNNLKKHNMLQKSIDRLVDQVKIYHWRQNQLRFFFGIGATLIFCGTIIITQKANEKYISYLMITSGIIIWIIGYKRRLKRNIKTKVI